MTIRLTKDDMARVAAHLGHSPERFERQWAEFVEFRTLVESSADRIGIPRPSPQFSAFGLAMLDAKTLGEFEALERLVWNAE